MAVCVTPVKLRLVGAVGVGGAIEKILLEPCEPDVKVVIAPAV
jgi:hypothetical protein